MMNALRRLWATLRRPSSYSLLTLLVVGAIGGILFWGGFHTALEAGHVLGAHLVRDRFEVDLVAAPGPAHQPVLHHGAGCQFLGPGGKRRELGVEQHVPVEHVERDLVEHVVAHDVHGEQPLQGAQLLRQAGATRRDIARIDSQRGCGWQGEQQRSARGQDPGSHPEKS